MDLSNLNVVGAANQGATMELRHPTSGEALKYDVDGEERVMHLVLLGRDSDELRRNQRKIIDKRLRDQQRGRVTKVAAADLERESVEILASAVVGGVVYLQGKEVPVTSDTFVDLVARFPWIREQADAFVEDRSNFLRD